MIATLARKDGRDAVFDVPQQVLRARRRRRGDRSSGERPERGRARPRPRGGAAGGPGDAHLRGPSRIDRSPAGDVARSDRHRHGSRWRRRRSSTSRPRRSTRMDQPARGLDRRPRQHDGVSAQRRSAALRSGRSPSGGLTPAKSSSPPACRPCIRAKRFGCSG